MKLCLKSKVININILRDLKRNFEVIYPDSKDSYKCDLILEDDMIQIDGIEVDLSHWISVIERGKTSISLSEMIKFVMEEYNETKDGILV